MEILDSSTLIRGGAFKRGRRRGWYVVSFAIAAVLDIPQVNKHEKHSMSPRILLSLQGFEWFLVNRTPAYDYILSQIDPDEFKRSTSRETRKRPPTSESEFCGLPIAFKE
jgi:hypothetical protein